MIKLFEDDYIVCTCTGGTLKEIKEHIRLQKNGANLRSIQEELKIGTHCRNCLIQETDDSLIKKRIYCKDILSFYEKEING